MADYKRYCEMRDARNIRDADVAKATGIGKSTFSDWKSGRSSPKDEKLRLIADYFDTTLDYLTGKSSDPYVRIGDHLLNSANGKIKLDFYKSASKQPAEPSENVVSISDEAKQFALAYDQAPEDVKQMIQTALKYSKPAP